MLLENEQTNTVDQAPNGEEENGAQPYIDAINELKRNSVPVEEYKRLQLENQQLLNTLVNGGTIDEGKVSEPEIKDEQLIKDLTTNPSNLAVWKASLELRKRAIQRGEVDPYLPSSSKYAPTENDISGVERVVKAIEECIERADGDATVFDAELKRRCPTIFLHKKK